MLIDSHAHIQGKEYAGEAEAVIERARAAGVEKIIAVGGAGDMSNNTEAVALADSFPNIYATVGMHPHDAKDGVATITDLFGDRKVVAVGECGLDYYYDNSPRDVQRAAFAEQIGLAHRLALPLVIHTRDAWDDTFDILRAEGAPPQTIFHCFTGGPEQARTCLDFGAFLSFSGIVTFPTATDLQDAASMCPLDRLLVETDAPFLTPVPHRGRPNTPAYIPLIGAAVAAAKDLPVERIEQATWETTERLFRLPE